VKGAAVVAGFVGVGVGVLVVAAAAGGGSPVVGVQRVGGAMVSTLGRFFSWAELTASGAASRLGLDNTPPPAAQVAMQRLVAVLLDPLRERLGRPIVVTSGYRSAAVNRAVSGSPTSQHMSGEAVDIKVAGMSAQELANAVVRSGLPFDQVIWYAPERGGHVHVSYTEKRANRREVLHAPVAGGYLSG
jgi:zinc D-Ala-D-Ala carboxypeptidase